MGQLSDPYNQGEDEGLGISISGLPGELDEPEPDEDTVPGGPEPDGDTDAEVVYDLDDWSEIERGAVTDRLREAGIPHGWEATSLHVAEADEAAVENILDIVEGDSEADRSLDSVQDQVAYDLSDWEDDRLTARYRGRGDDGEGRERRDAGVGGGQKRAGADEDCEPQRMEE